jgi:hypothetical protein
MVAAMTLLIIFTFRGWLKGRRQPPAFQINDN